MVSVSHYLPRQATSFIGRESEVAAVTELLVGQDCRLLTLVGPGGIGKTRLGIEVAKRFANPDSDDDPLHLFPDGVYLVTLQSVAFVNSIIQAIASSLGFEFHNAHNTEGQLINHIGDKQLLLILDNMEHLLDAGDLIGELLSSAPHLKILVTSREPLNLLEEWLFHVEGVPFPDSEHDAMSTTDRLAKGDYDAVRLFVERARRVRYDFSLEHNRACVVRLCQLVDGMPLAIELAAAWLKSLSCMQVVTKIQHNLDILETDMRGVPDRHKSMRAVFDHSWQLLDREERDLFMMLSVFRGGFRPEAAEKIAGTSLQSLSALVDKSMVVLQSNGRYQLHELPRQYGAEQLEKTSSLKTAVRDRHCEYYTAFMDRPYQDYYGYRSKEFLKEIDAEIDNVQAAWNWAASHSLFRDLHACINGLYHYTWHRSWQAGVERAYRDGLTALRSAHPSPERDITLGWALAHQSLVDLWMGRLQIAIERAEEGIAILEPLDAQRELAAAFGARASVSRFEQGRNPEEAKALIVKASALFDETSQYGMLGFMYTTLGALSYDIGQYSDSEKWYQKSLSLSRRIDDPRSESQSLSSLGLLALTVGEYGKARQILLESLEIARDLKNSEMINCPLSRLGLVAMAVGDLETAERNFQECLASSKELGRPYSIANYLINLAYLFAAREEYMEATALYQESKNYFESSRMLQALRFLGLGQIAFGEGQYAVARQLHGESLRLCKENGYRLQKVHNDVALGGIALANGLAIDATSHLGAALRESISIGTPPLILDSMISIGELVAFEGDQGEASKLAMLVLDHPASRAQSKERATRLLGHLESERAVAKIEMLNMRVAQDDLVSVATQILTRLSMAEESAIGPDVAISQPLLDPLSQRELELLRLVAEGKSNREIAQELTLALGTVKSHLHNIFQKLDAGSRTQALVRARELDLL